MKKHTSAKPRRLRDSRPVTVTNPKTLFEAAPVAVRPVMSRTEAADYLRISLRTLLTLVADGKIKARKLRGRTLFRRPDLDAALN